MRLDRARGLARAKPKNFPYLSSFPRRGVWGEPTKNGKEIFGFASPFQSPKRALLFYHILIALFSALTATEALSYPRLVVTLNPVPPTESNCNSLSGLCMAQTNLYVLAPPALCAHKSPPFLGEIIKRRGWLPESASRFLLRNYLNTS